MTDSYLVFVRTSSGRVFPQLWRKPFVGPQDLDVVGDKVPLPMGAIDLGRPIKDWLVWHRQSMLMATGGRRRYG